MIIEERIQKLLSADADTLAQVDSILDGRPTETTPGDRRLLTLTEAAHELNVSRMTIHRMCADGRLPVIETRKGRRRIASQALTSFLEGGVK